MCGIFAYSGNKNNAAEIVLEGLKTLEYRGYDSWGIAVNNKLKIDVEKHVGKIGDAKTKLTSSQVGIGHTRWATHGGATIQNAHPHLDCNQEIAVLHNGIIENYQELKKQLVLKGHKFISETDTEVVPHLIEENLNSSDFSSAVKNAFNKLHGLNAIVATKSGSKQIIIAKTGSPIVIGEGENEIFAASDALGIIKYTKKLVFLQDNQMAIISDNSLKIVSLASGEQVKPKFETINWEFESTQKGEYSHFLLKEISEQPKVIEHVALNLIDQSSKLANLISHSSETFMLGCGTASYAALAGTYLFSTIAKKQINFSIGSEFEYLLDYLTPKSLIIPISQSGETIDVVDPIEKAHRKGAKIAAIVNVLGSTLYRQADFKLLLGAGPERAVVGTKSFIAMISVLYLTAKCLVGLSQEAKENLLKAAIDVRKILTHNYQQKIIKLAQKLYKSEHIYIIGRGLSYPTALEATLKLKETCYIHAEGFAGGELKHGVIALIEKGTPCIVLAPNDQTLVDLYSNAQEIKARGGYMIGIGPKNNPVFDVFLETDDLKEITMISQVVISQLLAYFLALKKGIKDPDKPRNLAKSVTVK